MGLDIYAGTLPRYYSNNRKTAVQQWAAANGYIFQKITPYGQDAADAKKLSPAEVQDFVENGREQISAAISQLEKPPYAHRLRITGSPTIPTSWAGTIVVPCCLWLLAIPIMRRFRLLWRRNGMSWSIPWSSGLKRIRRGWSPGSLFRDRQPLWECFVRSWISSISWHVRPLRKPF